MSKTKHTTDTMLLSIIASDLPNREIDYNYIVHAIRSHDALVAALEAWRLFDSESSDKHPCPDLMLRGKYRDQARKLTDVALAEARKDKR